MTQNIFAAAIISFGIILGGYLLGTQGFVISTAPAVKTLQVSADGKVKAIPDTVILSAGVEVHTRATQELAYQDMNQSINAVKEILNNAGVEEKNIQTSGLFAGPEYHYEDGKQIQDGYQASTNLTIRVEKKDPKVTNDILDAIAKVQDIRMNGISYDVAEEEKIYTEARKLALEKAREKAEEMARVSGVSIAGIQSISETIQSGVIPLYANARVMDASSLEKSTATDISPGQIEYVTTVNVSYEIR